MDYRKINEKTIKDAYPLARIDENLDTLEGAEWYSSLDLDMAYHQVPMEPEDKRRRLLQRRVAVCTNLRQCHLDCALPQVLSSD